MIASISSPTDDIQRLRERGEDELSDQFESFRARLKTMIALRTDSRLRQRVDQSDVVQEAYIEAVRRLDQYLENPKVAPEVWMRQIGRQVLARQYRRHFGAAKRNPENEQSLQAMATINGEAVQHDLSASMSSPSSVVAREELCSEVRRLLMELDPVSREVLCLKQIEGLTFEQIAEELDMSRSAVNRRMAKAVEHFRQLGASLGKQYQP